MDGARNGVIGWETFRGFLGNKENSIWNGDASRRVDKAANGRTVSTRGVVSGKRRRKDGNVARSRAVLKSDQIRRAR